MCEVCGGKGFVLAAPVGTGAYVAIGPNSEGRVGLVEQIALWRDALIVPCFACREATKEEI